MWAASNGFYHTLCQINCNQSQLEHPAGPVAYEEQIMPDADESDIFWSCMWIMLWAWVMIVLGIAAILIMRGVWANDKGQLQGILAAGSAGKFAGNCAGNQHWSAGAAAGMAGCVMADNRRAPHHYELQDVLDAIKAYKRANDGCSPPWRWLMEQLDVSSTSVMSNLLERLEADGEIELRTIPDGKHRVQIIVVGGSWQAAHPGGE